MTKLLEANEICCPFTISEVSTKILGNYILFRIKQELRRDDANELGSLLIDFIKQDLAALREESPK